MKLLSLYKLDKNELSCEKNLKSLSSASSMKLKSCGVASFAVAGMVYTSLSLVSKAEAFTIVSTDSFADQPTELTGTPLLTLERFDTIANPLGPNLAVTKVEVATSGTIRTSGTVTNNAPNPQTFRITVAGELAFTKDGGAPTSINDPIETIITNTTIGTRLFGNLASGASANFNNAGNPYSISRTTLQTITNISEIAQFLSSGPSTFTFAPSTLIGTTTSGGGGNIANAISTFVDGHATVTYTVETIPFEFSPVLGVGLLGGLYGLNQLRKKKANSVK
jgi:hypothetical protein